MRLVLYHKLFHPSNNQGLSCSSSLTTPADSDAAKYIFNHVVRMRNNDVDVDDDNRIESNDIDAVAECTNWKDGFDISLQQLQAVCEEFVEIDDGKSTPKHEMTRNNKIKVPPLSWMTRHNNPTSAATPPPPPPPPATRLIVRLNPSSADDVSYQLNSLSKILDQSSSSSSSPAQNLFPPRSFTSTDESNNYDGLTPPPEQPIFDLDMVIIHRPTTTNLLTSKYNSNDVSSSSSLLQHNNNNSTQLLTDIIVEYLYQVLPYGVKFLEYYPYVGSYEKHGQCNAHGNPIDQHVIGICHDLGLLGLPQQQEDVSSSSSSLTNSSSSSNNHNHTHNNILSNVVDLLPPTRLSISTSQNIINYGEEKNVGHINSSRVDDNLGWEAIQQSTDHLDITTDDDDDGCPLKDYDKEEDGGATNISSHHEIEFCKQVWDWQYRVANAKETYVSCSNENIARKVIGLYHEQHNCKNILEYNETT